MPAEAFDPLPLLETLGEAEVDFVVIGGLAGGAHGSSYPTYDLDITYARTRENVERLSTALRRLGSPTNAPTIDNAARLTHTTKHGPLDLVADPAGAPTYAVLKANAVRATVSGHEVRLASLDHLIAMKEAAGRTKDKLMATEYRIISDVLRAPDD